MTICPIAIAVGCKKCPLFKICPVKSVLGDIPKTSDKPVVTPVTKARRKPVTKPVGKTATKVAARRKKSS